jgi:hypothetical protein
MTRKTISNFIKAAALSLAFGAFTATSANAGLTSIKAPKTGEMGIEQILEGTYGGNFTLSGGNLTNGTITAVRVDDDLDQTFAAGTYDICAKAKFSGYTQSLGYMDETGGTMHSLFSTSGFGLGCIGSAGNIVIGDEFCFTRDGESGLQMSENNENSDGRDHVITFAIEGLNQQPTYLMFFEDLNLGGSVGGNRSYADYNDLVVQLSRVTGSPIAAPLPPAVLSGGLLLIGNGILGLKRRMKRAGK